MFKHHSFPLEMTSQAPQVSSTVPGMFKSSISSILFLGFACWNLLLLFLFFLGYVQAPFFPPEMISQASSTVHGMKKLEFQVFFFLVLLVEFNFLLLFLSFLEDVQASFFPLRCLALQEYIREVPSWVSAFYNLILSIWKMKL